MNWMKYFGMLSLCSLIFIVITPPSHAEASLSNANNIAIFQDSSNNLFYVVASNSNFYVENNRFYYQEVSSYSDSRRYFATYDLALEYVNNVSFYITTSSYKALSNLKLLVLIKGNINVPTGFEFGEYYFPSNDSYQDYLNPPVLENWWDKMWNWLEEDMNKPLGFTWWKNLINDVFGDDSDGTISDNVTIGNPTLAPTPTPIPYTTVVIPKTDVTTGETYYETNYYYVNPSGTPIVTGSPPVNSPTNNGGGNGGSEYSPMNGQPYSIPKLDWLSSVDIDGTGYDGIDSIGDGMSSIDEIGSEYTDGMSAVQDATGTLPTDWLLLIGIVAAIPLLAGIVSRFLGG